MNKKITLIMLILFNIFSFNQLFSQKNVIIDGPKPSGCSISLSNITYEIIPYYDINKVKVKFTATTATNNDTNAINGTWNINGETSTAYYSSISNGYSKTKTFDIPVGGAINVNLSLFAIGSNPVAQLGCNDTETLNFILENNNCINFIEPKITATRAALYTENYGNYVTIQDITEIPLGWTVIEREWVFFEDHEIIDDLDDSRLITVKFNPIENAYEFYDYNLNITIKNNYTGEIKTSCPYNTPHPTFRIRSYENCDEYPIPNNYSPEIINYVLSPGSNGLVVEDPAYPEFQFSQWSVLNRNTLDIYESEPVNAPAFHFYHEMVNLQNGHEAVISVALFANTQNWTVPHCAQIINFTAIKTLDGELIIENIEYSDFAEASEPFLTIDSVVNVFPNPVNDILSISVNDDSLIENASIELYDLMGNRVKNISNIKEKEFTLNVSDLRKGVYSLRIISDRGLLETQKLVIE